MKYLLLSLLVISMSVSAAEKKVAQSSSSMMKPKTTATKEAEGTLDVTPGSKEKEMADETALYTEKHMMKAKVSCKAKDGHELKQGEKGYEECLKKVKSDKSDVKVEFEK